MMLARRARLLKTKENSLTWARPADTIHRMCREPGGKIADNTNTAITNWETMRSEVERVGSESLKGQQEGEERVEREKKAFTFIMTRVSVSTSRMVSSYSTNVGNTWRPAASHQHTR